MSLRLVTLLGWALLMNAPLAVEIIGHRGASHDAPENTLASMKLAFQQGADAAELDIHLSKDGKIVVLHDADLKRTGGAELKVAESNFDEMRRVPVGAWGQWAGKGFDERPPELSEVFPLVPSGKRLFIEIKCGQEVLPALERAIASSRLEPKQLPIITFHFDVAVAAKRLLPRHEVFWLHGWSKDKRTGELPNPDAIIQKAKDAGLDGLDLNWQFPIDRAFVKKIEDAGMKLYTWTVNDPAVARAEMEAGVAGITTDRPGWMREQLGLTKASRE